MQDNPQKPFWDEKFTFDITTGKEELKVIVAYKDVFGANDIIGRCSIPLEFLRDQLKHDEWFDLETVGDNRPGGISGSIQLQI